MQFAFLAVNGTGILLATIYNASTPDLYPNNAHHKLGWVVTWIVVAQFAMGVITAYTGRQAKKAAPAYLAVSSEAMREHHRWQGLRSPQAGRFSNDSGQGTERNTESLRSQSISSSSGDDQLPSPLEHTEEGNVVERQGLLRGSRVDHFLRKRIPGLLPSRILRAGQFGYDVVDRVILLLGFAALTTGIVTFGGLFVSCARLFSRSPTRIYRGPYLLYPAILCLRFLTADLDGRFDLQRPRTLYQGRRFLLVRHLDPRKVGGMFCRHWLGKWRV